VVLGLLLQSSDWQSASLAQAAPSGCRPHLPAVTSQKPDAQSWSLVQSDPFGCGPHVRADTSQ
jgi:hypothetical protein